MADSTTNLDLISSSQASKEITANSLFDAESPAALYGRRASTTANLTWGYYGGRVVIAGNSVAIANGTVALSNGATNYIEAVPTTGGVSVNTSNFTTANIPLYAVVTAGNLVTSYTDYRSGPVFFANRSGSSSVDFATANLAATGNMTSTGSYTPGAGGVVMRSASATGAAAANLTPSAALADLIIRTAQGVNLTINAPTSTSAPLVNGQRIEFRFRDNGVARTLTWDAIYRIIGTTLPTTTVANKLTYVMAEYNVEDTKWDVVRVNQEV